MNANQTELSYRQASAQQASPAGLVVILYDLLVADLRQAIAAMRSGRVEERCDRLKHSLLVLQLLEGSLDLERGSLAAQNLSHFYAYIRSQILAAQFKREKSILEQQIVLVLDVREAWRLADCSATPLGDPNLAAQPNPSVGDIDSFITKAVTNWSA